MVTKTVAELLPRLLRMHLKTWPQQFRSVASPHQLGDLLAGNFRAVPRDVRLEWIIGSFPDGSTLSEMLFFVAMTSSLASTLSVAAHELIKAAVMQLLEELKQNDADTYRLLIEESGAEDQERQVSYLLEAFCSVFK